MKLAVIFAVRNCLELTIQAITSVETRHEHQIYVVDHNSNQETASWLDSQPYLTVIRDPKTKGLANNWNLGIKRALEDSCDYFAILNNDIILHPVTLDTLVDQLREYGAVMVTGVNVAASTTPETIKDSPAPEKSASEHPDFSCFMIGARFLEKIGLFDENYIGAYMEDCDTHARIALAGEKAICCGDAPYYHYASGTVKGNPELAGEIGKNHDLNKAYFRRKWGMNHVNHVEEMRELYFKTPFNDPQLTVKDW